MADLEEEIFGADSDEEDIFAKKPTSSLDVESSSIVERADDDLFKDSDDEAVASSSRKLKRIGSNKKPLREESLMDSDDEDIGEKKDRSKHKRVKKRKRGDERHSDSNVKVKKVEGGREHREKDGSSGDEYDSGGEVKETEEDRDFIDEDDDQAEVRREYDEDAQNFDDERPTKLSSKKSSSSSKASASNSNVRTKDSDPLSQTLNEIRKPKLKPFTDAEKDMMVEKLLKKMAQATTLDDDCFRKKEPALHKLNLLPAVQRAVSMKDLHNTLLDKDFLCYLRDWIEPKNASTLPALTLRSAVYEMLLKLPCLTEHLKRGNDKDPIGCVIVALRKHKMETPENKRILKEIMDKWSRPIFSKTEGSSEGISFMHSENEEIKAALVRKYSDNNAKLNSASNPTANSSKVQSIISGGYVNVKKDADLYNRARAPTSHGYLFTVQPELKNIDKRNVMEKALGEERMKLFKKMTEGGKSSSTGRKSNPRAMNISVSGNNLKH